MAPGSDRDSRAESAGATGDLGRMRRIGNVIAELAAVQDMDGLIETIVAHSAAAVKASATSLSSLDMTSRTFTMLGVSGGTLASHRRWAKYALNAHSPAG